jgi:hypothetical protein
MALCPVCATANPRSCRWRLPAAGPFATCKHCVLRSHWLTGHTCVPPCTRDHPYYPDCRKGVAQQYCGTRIDAYPEVGGWKWGWGAQGVLCGAAAHGRRPPAAAGCAREPRQHARSTRARLPAHNRPRPAQPLQDYYNCADVTILAPADVTAVFKQEKAVLGRRALGASAAPRTGNTTLLRRYR